MADWPYTVEAIEEGKSYGALYGAADEQDARRMAADFLSRKLTTYNMVSITLTNTNERVATLTQADMEQTQTQTADQTAPNLVWVFAESEAVPSCVKTGRRLEFMAPTVEEAGRNLEYYLSLSDARAVLGKTGLVAYPHGIDGTHAWVFDAQETARAQGDRIPGEEVRL